MPTRTHFARTFRDVLPHALPHAHRTCEGAIIRTSAPQPNVWLKSPYFDVSKNYFFEQSDRISSKILPSFRTEAVEDRDVTFNQIQVSIVKCPLPMNIQIPFIFQILSSKTLQMLLTLSRFETKHPVVKISIVRGSKIADFEMTQFMDGPLLFWDGLHGGGEECIHTYTNESSIQKNFPIRRIEFGDLPILKPCRYTNECICIKIEREREICTHMQKSFPVMQQILEVALSSKIFFLMHQNWQALMRKIRRSG